ncbi:uncharacterized protein LOC141668372 isoform X1 [Apium graveolens]|uniref:uncharacterized protein LOC141668372 isoform X1 n=1 Tax=Apium graveolens TaxID=4045 RepID=UPI003D7A6735
MMKFTDMFCFEGLLICPETFSLLLHKFCIYHISPPGHKLGAVIMSTNDPVLAVMTWQIRLLRFLIFLVAKQDATLSSESENNDVQEQIRIARSLLNYCQTDCQILVDIVLDYRLCTCFLDYVELMVIM